MKNIDRLEAHLGYDPQKPAKVTTDLLSEIHSELTAQRRAQAKERATGLLKQAIELADKAKKAKKAFEAEMAKFDKEIGRLLNELEAAERPPVDSTPPTGTSE